MSVQMGLNAKPGGDEAFADALERIMFDPELTEAFYERPAETLEFLGVPVEDKERARLASAGLKAALAGRSPGVEALSWTKPLVKVATKGTKPVVSVAVNVAVNTVVAETVESPLRAKQDRAKEKEK
jgi:hypothetical protein